MSIPINLKIVIFGDRTRNADIIFDDEQDSFKYLGVLLPKSHNFHQTKSHIAEQARKALFGLYQKIRI